MPPRRTAGTTASFKKGSTSASTAASAPTPTYALPTADDVPISDDWTRIDDRKEKKRMQNRVAQRTFRNDTLLDAPWDSPTDRFANHQKGHRTKARIEELQTKLRYYEWKDTEGQQGNQSTAEEVEDEEEGETKDEDNVALSALSSSSAAPSSGAVPVYVSTPPRCNDATYVATDNTDNSTPVEHVALQPDYFGRAMTAGDNMRFVHSASDAMMTPSLSNPMNDSRNPYSRASTRLDGISDGKVSKEAVLEILRFQNELLGKLNGPDNPAPIPELIGDGTREDLPSMMRNPLVMDPVANNGGCAAAFMGDGTNGMGFAFSHAATDHWTSDMASVSPKAMRENFGHHPGSPPTLPDKRNGHGAMGSHVFNRSSGSSLPPIALEGSASVVGWDLEDPEQHPAHKQPPSHPQPPSRSQPRPHPQPTQQPQLQLQTRALSETGGTQNQHSPPIPINPPPNSEPLLDTNFQTIMRAAESVGCANFDALVLSYYSGTFREDSQLAYEQRLSRKRQLPGVLSEIFRASHDWTPWERRGLHDEILKTTETMLMRESLSMRKGIMPYFDAMRSGDESDGGTGGGGGGKWAISDMTRLVQNEQPNLWALIMALGAPDDRGSTWQQDRSRTALATIILTQFAGRVPKERLLSFIDACL